MKNLDDKLLENRYREEGMVNSDTNIHHESLVTPRFRSATSLDMGRSTRQQALGRPPRTMAERLDVARPTSSFVFLQALSLTFFAEWGDRSQIYTIALASKNSAILVFMGAWTVSLLVDIVAYIESNRLM